MARSHRMTPARRAALRKAQLASARKRRKSGAISQARKSISQSRQSRAANRQLRAAAKRRSSTKRSNRRAAVLTAASLAGTAITVAGAVYGSKTPSKVRSGTTKATPPRALGPAKPVRTGRANSVPQRPGTLFKTNRKGVTMKTTHARQQYNARRRKNPAGAAAKAGYIYI